MPEPTILKLPPPAYPAGLIITPDAMARAVASGMGVKVEWTPRGVIVTYWDSEATEPLGD